MDGGKFKRRLSEVNTRAVSRGQNELVCKFKMAAGDMVSIRGQDMEYTYIPTGIKRELMRSGVDCNWKGYYLLIIDYLSFRSLNKSGLAAAQVIFESTIASTAQNRRKTHSELQEKLNAMATNVRLFEKGLKQFSDKEVQQQLVKYLLKSLCLEVTNEIFTYVAQENLIQFEQGKELTPEVRKQMC